MTCFKHGDVFYMQIGIQLTGLEPTQLGVQSAVAGYRSIRDFATSISTGDHNSKMADKSASLPSRPNSDITLPDVDRLTSVVLVILDIHFLYFSYVIVCVSTYVRVSQSEPD